MADDQRLEADAPNRQGTAPGAPVPPPGVVRDEQGGLVAQNADLQQPGQPVAPEGQQPAQTPGSGMQQPAQDNAAHSAKADDSAAAGQTSYYKNIDSEQDDSPNGPQMSSGVFGRNGRWLWFAGGVLFRIFGVLIALLFNMGRTREVRIDAVKYAAWGLLVGFFIEVVVLYYLGGVDVLFQMLGMPTATSSSSGSVF